jgi:hypothetical protein
MNYKIHIFLNISKYLGFHRKVWIPVGNLNIVDIFTQKLSLALIELGQLQTFQSKFLINIYFLIFLLIILTFGLFC